MFGLRVPLGTLAANVGCCQWTGSERYSGSTIAFVADTGRLETVRNQYESCAIALAVELANAAKRWGFAVTAGSTYAEGVECVQQRPSAAPCIGPVGAAVGIVPEPEAGLSALGSTALVVSDHVVLHLC